MDVKDNADVIVGTFSKSLASVGGFVCASEKIITWFEYFAQGFMFSAAISVYSAAAAYKSLLKLQLEEYKVQELQNNAKIFRDLLRNAIWSPNTPEIMKFKVGGLDKQPILPVIFYVDPLRVARIATKLKEEGFLVSPVVYPACPAKEPRLRITCIQGLSVDIMKQFVEKCVYAAETTDFCDRDLISMI